MRVAVDPWKCQSNLQCVAIAPPLFEYDDDHSYARALAGDVPPELEEAARRAVAQCPERAISIE
jgi:ferredoxin